MSEKKRYVIETDEPNTELHKTMRARLHSFKQTWVTLREVPAPTSGWKQMSEFVDDGNVYEFLYDHKELIAIGKWSEISNGSRYVENPRNFLTHFRPHIPPVEKDQVNFTNIMEKFRKKYKFSKSDRMILEALWKARGESKT